MPCQAGVRFMLSLSVLVRWAGVASLPLRPALAHGTEDQADDEHQDDAADQRRDEIEPADRGTPIAQQHAAQPRSNETGNNVPD